MPEDTAQSKPDSALGKARTPRSLPGADHSSLVTRHPSLGLEEARALVASPLWPRIRAFLWDFASLCDPARLEESLVTRHSSLVTAEGLLGSPRAARAAEQALGLAPFFHSFPAADSSHLLLLSREDYDRLAQFLGTVALAPALRRVTAGAEVRALKAALPGVYPEALAFAAYFHKHEPLFKKVAPADACANAETICAAGHAILAAALSDLAPELLLRQRLRFPAGSPADAAFGGASSPSEPQASGSADHPVFGIQHSELAGEARAAALLALKLSNPTEYSTLCS
jgi:hypothetical protein